MTTKCLKTFSYQILFMALLLFSISVKPVCAQESEAYEKSFKEKFPTVAAPMWIRKGDDTYEATFKLSGAFVSSVYTADGKWLFNKAPVDSSHIPTLIKTAVTKKYKDAKITFAEKVETADKGIQYRLSIKSGTKKMEELYDEQGNFIK